MAITAVNTDWHPDMMPEQVYHDLDYMKKLKEKWQDFAGDSDDWKRLFRAELLQAWNNHEEND